MGMNVELTAAAEGGHGNLVGMMLEACDSYVDDNPDILELSHPDIVLCLRADVLDYDNWDYVFIQPDRFNRIAKAVAITIADELRG